MRTLLENCFTANITLVLFVYGLSFFGMGLAVITTRLARRYKPLKLDRGMPWLAAFGFAHGLHEWGSMFIPIQATYMPPEFIIALRVLHVLLLAASFAFLLCFGFTLLEPQGRYWRYLPGGLFIGWLVFAFLFPFWRGHATPGWDITASIWARYLLGFPGGLVAAAGIHLYIREELHTAAFHNIATSLKIAAAALGAYAFLGGLVVPPANFFPANVLNRTFFMNCLGIPIYVFRATVGVVLAGAVINAMKIFDVDIERRLEQMRVQQNIAKERERIARELHDNTIQTIYAAGLLIESIAVEVGPTSEIGQQLSSAVHSLNEAIDNLRSYIGDLRPLVSKADLRDGLEAQITDLNLSALLDVHLEVSLPPQFKCNPTRTAHVLAIVREALSNTVRHAHARRVDLQARAVGKHLVVTIRDDGHGFQLRGVERGYGLRNMYDRARLLGGTLTIDTAPGQGTTITLSAPLEEMR